MYWRSIIPRLRVQWLVDGEECQLLIERLFKGMDVLLVMRYSMLSHSVLGPPGLACRMLANNRLWKIHVIKARPDRAKVSYAASEIKFTPGERDENGGNRNYRLWGKRQIPVKLYRQARSCYSRVRRFQGVMTLLPFREMQ